MKKILSLILACFLLISSLALISCGGNHEDDTTAKAQTDTDSPYLDELPNNLDFGNEEIAFLISESDANGSDFSARSIGINNYILGGNNVDDAVFRRNQAVEERLGIVIEATTVTDAVLHNAVLTDLSSGTSDYDVISGYEAHDIALAAKGLILNTASFAEDDADYIDIKREYWGTTYINAITYQNKVYWLTGDLAFRYLGGVICNLVNTEMYSDKIESTYGSIYKLVEDKKWTLEKAVEMNEMAYDDSGTIVGKLDSSDTIGYVVNFIDAMAVSAGIHFSEVDPGGNIYISLSSTDEKVQKFIDLIYTNFTKEGLYEFNTIKTFASGNTLMNGIMLCNVETHLGNMENYGIIPMPMLDEDQGQYYTDIWDSCNLYGVYYGCKNIPAVAATLEALAAASLQTVTPQYYDLALCYRYTRDEESTKMIQLLRDTVYIDFAYAWGNSILSIHNAFRDFVQKPYSTSSIKKYESQWEGALETLLTTLATVDEAK